MMSLFGTEEQKNTNKTTETKKNNQKLNNKKEKVVKEKIIKIKNINETIENRSLKKLQEIQSFSIIEKNIVEHFTKHTLHHAIMFSGHYGIGKATFAYWLVSKLILSQFENLENYQQLKEMHLEMLNNNIHPDVFFLQLQEGDNEIKIEQIRNFLEKIYLKSNYGAKFVIIDDINSININGINALLKTLEEPPNNTYFFIINHKISALLDTVYSRCNEINLKVSKNDCLKILQQQHNNLTFQEIEFYADISCKSIGFSNIMIDLNLKDLIDNFFKNQQQSTSMLLNTFYNNLDAKYKNLSRNIKMSILENIVMYLVEQNIKNTSKIDTRSIVLKNNGLLKQFLDIKKFELPVAFI